ncbi:MAG: hypothetical protein WC869_13985, partial [Phycisphaerae bacterium]
MGDVKRPGVFGLPKESMTLKQLLAGVGPDSGTASALLLRLGEGKTFSPHISHWVLRAYIEGRGVWADGFVV